MTPFTYGITNSGGLVYLEDEELIAEQARKFRAQRQRRTPE